MNIILKININNNNNDDVCHLNSICSGGNFKQLLVLLAWILMGNNKTKKNTT